MSRPLLSISGITDPKTIWNSSRDDLVYNPSVYAATVVEAKIRNLGIIIGEDSGEYPLWRYFRKNSGQKIRIIHIKEDDIDSNIDVLLIYDRTVPDIIQSSFGTNTPLVLKRNMQNKSGWEILYSTDSNNLE
jgi:hypothetical protein